MPLSRQAKSHTGPFPVNKTIFKKYTYNYEEDHCDLCERGLDQPSSSAFHTSPKPAQSQLKPAPSPHTGARSRAGFLERLSTLLVHVLAAGVVVYLQHQPSPSLSVTSLLLFELFGKKAVRALSRDLSDTSAPRTRPRSNPTSTLETDPAFPSTP